MLRYPIARLPYIFFYFLFGYGRSESGLCCVGNSGGTSDIMTLVLGELDGTRS